MERRERTVMVDVDRARAIMAEVDRAASIPLWPGFDPRRVPVAIFDGTDTLLIRHPNPPAGFVPDATEPGIAGFVGLHSAVRANTAIELNGIPTATVMLGAERGATPSGLAALIVHEAFHVFQRERHPDWIADEAELFVYPSDSADLLGLARLEAEALRRAVVEDDDRRSAGWAATVIALRRERFGLLSAGAVAYERGSELQEGLARYVESKVAPRAVEDTSRGDDVAPDNVRGRCYASGHALARLLDRLSPGWAVRLEREAGVLDELLALAVARVDVEPAAFSADEVEAVWGRAEADVRRLQAERERLRDEFLSRPGWRLSVRASADEPLRAEGFDPMNVRRLDDGTVLHTRYLKLGNASASLEVLGRSALTVAAGAHPLFEGVGAVTLTGLDAEPIVRREGDAGAIDLPDVVVGFDRARVDRRAGAVEIVLGMPPEVDRCDRGPS